MLANYHQFNLGAIWQAGPVESRMLLWCRSGNGMVAVNGTPFSLTPGRFLLLPWRHTIVYTAHNRFLVAGIHVIPHLPPERALCYRVCHDAPPRDRELTGREDRPLAGLESCLTGRLVDNSALEHLAEYIVTWFQHRARQAEEARHLARLLIAEWLRLPGGAGADLTPDPFRRMVLHVQQHLAEPLTIATLARAGGVSRPTVNRLFQRLAGRSPMAWVQEQRLAEAGTLLTTTRLPVGAIGKRVGIPDPHYFSKCFRQHFGKTASAHRRAGSLV